MAGRIAKFLGVILAGACLLANANAAGGAIAPRIKPPAPGPAYLSRLDEARLLTVHNALEKKQFSLALAEIKFVEDPTARALGQWLYYAAKDPTLSIADADAFLDAHPDWPAISRIQRHVESRLSYATPVDEILALFDARAPISGDGKVQYARALLAKGRSAEADAMIRDAWINHNFTVAEERKIINAYGSRLRHEDHAARVDRLLWSRQVTNARRTFPYLASKDRRMAEARAALLLGAATGPRLYRNLPKAEQLDSGLLHAAVRYYRRTDDQKHAIALAAKAPQTEAELRNTDRWWLERRLLLQWALKEGRPSDAYALATQNGMSGGGDFADAEFVAGWIALRFLNAPERAITHFEAMTGAVSAPISLARGYYWLGRAASAAGKEAEATQYYRSAANHHYSFYGQLAAEALGGAAMQRRFDPPVTPTAEDKARFNSRPAVAALRMLSDLDLDYEFMVFAYHIDDELERPGEFTELARLTNGEGAPHLTVRAGKVAALRNAFAADVSYPLVFVPDEARAFVRPEIILGLSRQESEFNPRAYSSAGARGVMQLIPSTAQITARKEGLPYQRSALLDDPAYNMTLGSAHLSHLLDRFGGSMIMTFAAYNAGANRADQWAADYGDPRTGEVDPIDWIELIPFSETRNYVQRVLENTQVYRGRLNDAPIPGHLAADLDRGGPSGRAGHVNPPSLQLAAMAQVNGDPGKLADLPAQTALLAAEFRAKRLAALAPPPAAPSIAPETPTTVRKRGRKLSKPLSDAMKRSPVPSANNAPQAVPVVVNDAPAAPEKTASPQPEAAQISEVEDEPEAKIIAQETPPAEQEPTSVSLAPRQENEPDAEPKAGPSLPVANEAPTEPALESASIVAPDQDRSEYAAKVVEKAAERLNIGDESDAIAAAIVRGLEQLEEGGDGDAAEPVSPEADACADAAASDDEDAAASLNTQMAAQLRGEDACAD